MADWLPAPVRVTSYHYSRRNSSRWNGRSSIVVVGVLFVLPLTTAAAEFWLAFCINARNILLQRQQKNSCDSSEITVINSAAMLPYHSHASHAFAPMPFSPPFFLAFLRLQIVANWFCPPSQITSLPMASDNLSKIQISHFWWLRQLVKSSLISDHDNISIISRQRSVPKVPFHISISPSTSSHPYPPSSILTTHTISSFFHITHSHMTYIYIHTLPTHIQGLFLTGLPSFSTKKKTAKKTTTAFL